MDSLEDIQTYSKMIAAVLASHPIECNTNPEDGKHFPLYLGSAEDINLQTIQGHIVKTLQLPHLLCTVYVVDCWDEDWPDRPLAVLVGKWDWPKGQDHLQADKDMDKDTQAKLVNEVAESVSSLQTDLTKLAQDVVLSVEKVRRDLAPLSSEDKQQVAVAVLEGYLKLPFPFNWCQGWILKLLVQHAVDALNQARGHDWFPAPTQS